MKSNKLAILGGIPVRKKPFVIAPMVGEAEEAMLLDAVRKNCFSLYSGAASPNLMRVLEMKSSDTRAISDKWHFLGGENIRHFGADFADLLNVDYAIPINSATSGLSVALAACGVGPGDEVIVPSLSFTATGTAVLLFNSIPVFVDVDSRTFCIDPKEIEKAITPRTKAILVVHLLGNACDMDPILETARRHSLKVIEDCAQAPGVRYKGRFVGTMGDAGVFSFQQSKNIMTGEGGMITTNCASVAKRARLILNHGETAMEDHHETEDLVNIVGMNLRMTELSAALGRAQLKRLFEVNEWRNRNFHRLVSRLESISGLVPPYIPKEVDYVSHVAAFLYDANTIGLSRSLFVEAVRAEGVPVGTGYVRPLYANPLFLKKTAYGNRGCPWTCGPNESPVSYQKGQSPVTEKLLGEQFIWAFFVAYPSTPEDMDDAANAIEKVLEQKETLLSAISTGEVVASDVPVQGWIGRTDPSPIEERI